MQDNDNGKHEMSPFGAALFQCLRNPDPLKQVEALNALAPRIEAGEFLSKQPTR